jgi:hypothetical protein
VWKFHQQCVCVCCVPCRTASAASVRSSLCLTHPTIPVIHPALQVRRRRCSVGHLRPGPHVLTASTSLSHSLTRVSLF